MADRCDLPHSIAGQAESSPRRCTFASLFSEEARGDKGRRARLEPQAFTPTQQEMDMAEALVNGVPQETLLDVRDGEVWQLGQEPGQHWVRKDFVLAQLDSFQDEQARIAEARLRLDNNIEHAQEIQQQGLRLNLSMLGSRENFGDCRMQMLQHSSSMPS